MKQLLRKARSRGGFSLVETMVALAVLALMGGAAALGVSQALQMRNQSIVLADAQTVASTAAQVMADQLRYGRIDPGHSGGAEVVLASGTYGATVCMGLDSDGYLTTRSASIDGGALVQGRAYALLGEDAYCGLHLSDLRFTLDTGAEKVNSVTVSFSVVSREDDHLWDLEFSVAPINEGTFELREG